MNKSEYLSAVVSDYKLGVKDGQAKVGKKVDNAAYAAGYDGALTATSAQEQAVITAASLGYDHGFANQPKSPPMPDATFLAAPVIADVKELYDQAYDWGVDAAAGSDGSQAKSYTGWIVAGAALVVFAGVFAWSNRKGAGVVGSPAQANPPETHPDRIRLQGIGWVNAKPASQIEVGDKLMWNYGYVSTVERVEQISPQFMSVKERTEDGKLYDRKMKVDKLVGIAGPASNPSVTMKTFVVSLDNMDQDEDSVVAMVQGPGASAWAKDDQSIAGSRWESDGPDFAYAILSDHPGLLDELKSEGYELDLDSYSPPEV